MAPRRVAYLVVVALAACAGAQPALRREDALDIPTLAAPASSRAPEDAGPSVTIRRRPARAGDRWRVTVKADSREQTSWGFEEHATYDTAYDVEVLAIEGAAPSRLRVHYDHNVRTSRGQETRTPVDGQTYLVEAAQKLRVVDGGELATRPDEAQLVSDMFPDLGAPGSVESSLREGALRVGDRQDGLARAVARLVHPRAVTLESGSATVARLEGDRLELALDMVLVWQMGSRAALKGKALVRSDGLLLRVALEGAFEDEDAAPRGHMTYVRELTYGE